MKNISRRVFIKGMAVAAVATAASTVLAGCNVSGNTTETPVVGFQPETKTLTLGDEKVTITTTEMGYNADGSIEIDLKVVNDGKNKITLKDATSIPNLQKNEVLIQPFFDGKYGNKVATNGFEITSKTEFAAKESNMASQDATTTVKITAVPEKWTSLTLVFILKAEVDGEVENTEVTFVLNK